MVAQTEPESPAQPQGDGRPEGANLLASVAVLAPVPGSFDYLVPPAMAVRRGDRVRVPFGRTERTGVVLAVALGTEGSEGVAIKPIADVLAPTPCLPEDLLQLVEWASQYYLHPLGEAFAAALPAPLRRPEDAPRREQFAWQLRETGTDLIHEVRGQRQKILLARLAIAPLPESALAEFDFDARATLRRMRERGWIVRVLWDPDSPLRLPPHDAAPDSASVPTAVRATADAPVAGVSSVTVPAANAPQDALPKLRPGQAAAVRDISGRGRGFHVTLLEGVTGSGKTEVYLTLLDEVLAQGQAGLVLVPEIGLAHSLAERFEKRFGAAFACYHSGLSERARLDTWEAARRGELSVVLGTRSAVWLPIPGLGLIVVDEEHDESFKQSEGFRYSGRDTAIVRAQRVNIPVVLGTATPALETLANVRRGRFAHVQLTERAIAALSNQVMLVDIRAERPPAGIGSQLQQAIAQTLERGEQALIFVNRRGFAPTVLCQTCGTPIECPNCTAPMVYHRRQHRMHCHHCNATRALSAPCGCGNAFEPAFLGAGTERVFEHLCERFPEARIERIDRDVVRSNRRRDSVFGDLRDGRIDIAVGTRMIAKGHHFPRVTLVGVVDADSRLFSPDFRAPERLAQGLEQVAGRAGRAELAGRVLVQTRNPEHPLFTQLFSEGYAAVADVLLSRRESAHLPPYSMLVLVRADARAEVVAQGFLEAVADALIAAFPDAHDQVSGGVLPMGPFPAPLLRKAGAHRSQLLLEVARSGPLLARLARIDATIRGLGPPRAIRWSVDVDPIEMG